MENRESKDNKISGRMWEAVEAKARKVGIAKAEGRRKETEREETDEKRKEKTKERKKDKNKKSSRRIGDLG